MNKLITIWLISIAICLQTFARYEDDDIDIDRQIFLNIRAINKIEDLEEILEQNNNLDFRTKQELDDLDRNLQLQFQDLTD